MTRHVSASSIYVGIEKCWALLYRTRFAPEDERRKEPTTAALVTGLALHDAMEWLLGRTQQAGLLGMDSILTRSRQHDNAVERFETAFNGRAGEVKWKPREQTETLRAGRSATGAIAECAGSIQPLALERPFAPTIAPDWEMTGRIDCIAADAIYDWKSETGNEESRARWTMRKAYGQRQPGIYSLAHFVRTGAWLPFAFIVSEKAQPAAVRTFRVPVTPERGILALVVARAVARVAEVAFPPPSGPTCTTCPFKGGCR